MEKILVVIVRDSLYATCLDLTDLEVLLMGVKIRGGHCNNLDSGLPVIDKVLIDSRLPRNNDKCSH